MNAVYEHSLEWHRVPAENMHKCRFILSFTVVNQSHHQSPTLNVSKLLLVSQQVKDRENKDRPKILNVKNVVPADLLSEVLQAQLIIGWQLGKFERNLIIRKDDLFVIGLEGDFLLMVWDFG